MLKNTIKRILPQRMWELIKRVKEFYFDIGMKRRSEKVRKIPYGNYPYGVNLMGDIFAESGLGQSMRIVAKMLETGNIPFMIRQIDRFNSCGMKQNEWSGRIQENNKYDINLIHINNSVWKSTYNQIPISDLGGRYNIAYWLWELEEFPEEWVTCIDTVDEIWTPAEFISEGIRKKTDKPVLTMPYGIELDTSSLLGREYFGLPKDKFLFLVMYDFLSMSERKNPHGAIQAYKQAFGKDDMRVGMVIKINNLQSKEELRMLQREMEGYPNIFFIADNFSRKEIESLIEVSDVLVSLHRAEGFGLPLAEAMYLKTAVIATNWSASTEFMDAQSACLVDYDLVTLEKNIGPYRKGNRWAEADIGQAAEYMRKLADDNEFFSNKVMRGHDYINECLQIEKQAERVAERLRVIVQNR